MDQLNKAILVLVLKKIVSSIIILGTLLRYLSMSAVSLWAFWKCVVAFYCSPNDEIALVAFVCWRPGMLDGLQSRGEASTTSKYPVKILMHVQILFITM